MIPRSLVSPIAALCICTLLVGCTTTTRVPLETAIPPATAGRELPDEKIVGYMDAGGANLKFFGTVRAIGSDSLRFQGMDSLRVRRSLESPGTWSLAPPERVLVVPRAAVSSLMIERSNALKSWAATLAILGVVVALIAVNVDAAGGFW